MNITLKKIYRAMRWNAVKAWFRGLARNFPWSLVYLFSRPENDERFRLLFLDRERWLDQEIAEITRSPKRYCAKTERQNLFWRPLRSLPKIPRHAGDREFAPWDRKGRI